MIYDKGLLVIRKVGLKKRKTKRKFLSLEKAKIILNFKENKYSLTLNEIIFASQNYVNINSLGYCDII